MALPGVEGADFVLLLVIHTGLNAFASHTDLKKLKKKSSQNQNFIIPRLIIRSPGAEGLKCSVGIGMGPDF